MAQSFFVNLFVCFFRWIKKCFDNSLFYKLQLFVSKLWKIITGKSFFANYFKTYPKSLTGSGIVKKRIFSAVRFVAKKIYAPLSCSFIFGTFYEYYKGFFTRSVKAYGLFVLSCSAVMLVSGFEAYRIIILALIVVSCIAIVADKSLAVMFGNSLFFKTGAKLFECDITGIKETEKNSFSGLLCHAVAGVVAGIGALVTKSPLIPLAVVGVVALGYFLYDYRIGIFASLILMPFAPTMGVVALVLLSFVSFVAKMLTSDDFTFRHTPLDTPVAIFSLILFISSVTSFSPVSSIKIFLVYFAFILGFYLTVNAVRTKKQLYALITSMLFAGAIVAIYGIYQHIFGFAEGTTWTDTEMFEDIETRVISTFGNPNVLGEYLLLLIPVAAGFVLSRPSKYNSVISLIVTALLSLCMVYTYSRGNWIGLIVAIILFFMFYDGRIIWLGVLFAFFIPMILPQNVIDRFLSVGNTKDTSTSYRVYIWMGSIAMLKDYWMSGIGLGSDAFNMIYPFYSYAGIVAPHAHNLYLHIMVENGILGMLGFVIIIITYYRMVIATVVTKGKDKMLKAIITGLSAGLFGYLVQGMFDNVWYNYRIVFMFYIIIALTCSAILIKREEDIND